MHPASVARSTGLWALNHGVPRVVFHLQARKGEPLARIQTDPVLREHPEAMWQQVRERGDLVRGGYAWVTASLDVGSRVLRGDEFGVPLPEPSSPTARRLNRFRDPWAAGPVDPPSLLAIDPPDHTRLRRLVSRAFTARRVAAMEADVEATTHKLLDQLAGERRTDLIESFAAQLPVTVIADLLGVPAEERAPLLGWGDGAARLLDTGLGLRQFRRAERAIREMHQWVDDHVERLRRQPGDDLLSAVIQQADDLPADERPTQHELRALALLVLGAGFETTVNLIGNAVQLLSDHPDQRDALVAAPDGWGNAVEEVLRYDSPVQLTARMVRRPVEVVGRSLRPGHAVVVMIGAMHRDPAVFGDPHRFDVTRENAADHLAFSAGPHFCLGAGLARVEARVGLAALYERYPSLSVEGHGVRRPTRVLRGFESLPVRLG